MQDVLTPRWRGRGTQSWRRDGRRLWLRRLRVSMMPRLRPSVFSLPRIGRDHACGRNHRAHPRHEAQAGGWFVHSTVAGADRRSADRLVCTIAIASHGAEAKKKKSDFSNRSRNAAAGFLAATSRLGRFSRLPLSWLSTIQQEPRGNAFGVNRKRQRDMSTFVSGCRPRHSASGTGLGFSRNGIRLPRWMPDVASRTLSPVGNHTDSVARS